MIKIEMKIVKYETFFIMGLLIGIFSIILCTSSEKSMLIPKIFYEIVVPGACCILFSFLLNMENDPPIELLLCTKYPVIKIMIRRYLILLSEVTIMSFSYMAILRYFYMDFKIGEMMICSIVSVFFLSILSVTLSVIFNSSITGSVFGILYWILFLITGERLGDNILFRLFNPFGYLKGYTGKMLLWNKTTLLAVSIMFFFIVYRISRNREYFMN